MTRDAEHTPSPQSVVVPPRANAWMVDAATTYAAENGLEIDAADARGLWFVMSKAAPAPSSLAGGEGEIEMIARAIDPDAWAHIDACHEAMKTCGEDKLPDFRKVIERRLHNSESIPAAERVIASLAALSPEAPAREANDNPLTFGMGALVVNTGRFGGDNAVFIARAKEPGEVGAFTGKSAFDRNVLQPGELVMIFPTAEQAQVVADALVGALTPRHEAPALDTGEWFGVTGAADETEALAVALFDARCPGIRMTDEDLHYYRAAAQRAMQAVADELDTPALTPRHEAPAEGAGEQEDRMSEGMPVCSECGGWGEHLSTCVRGGFRARSSAPEAREHPCYGEHQPGCDCVIPAQTETGFPPFLKRMTAAPSADKLRIAVEALLTLPELKKRQEHLSKGIGTATDEGKIVLQALAALKAEG